MRQFLRARRVLGCSMMLVMCALPCSANVRAALDRIMQPGEPVV